MTGTATAHDPTRRSHGTRRLLSGGLVAGLLATGAVAVSAPAAEAAFAVSYCFVWSDKTPYAKEPVFLMQVVDGRRSTLRKGRTDARGCGSFAGTPTDRRLFVRAETVIEKPASTFWWAGRTPETSDRGRGRADLGTGTVRVVKAISCASSDPASRCYRP